MKVTLPPSLIRQLWSEDYDTPPFKHFEDHDINPETQWDRTIVVLSQKTDGGYYRNTEVEINLQDIPATMVDKLMELVKEDAALWKSLSTKFLTFKKIANDPGGSTVGRLDTLVTALTTYVQTLSNKLLYKEGSDGLMLPYLVQNIKYQKATEHQSAYTSMDLIAFRRGFKETATITWSSTFEKATVIDLLFKKGWVAENDELNESHKKDVSSYLAIRDNTGKQFLAVGMGRYGTGKSYNQRDRSIVQDGKPSKVVLDDDCSDEDSVAYGKETSGTMNIPLWNEVMPLPIHPFVACFDLKRHDFFTTYITNLTEYEYTSTLNDKLVLPAQNKELIQILCSSSKYLMEDIVQGKTGGILVLATGAPGLGKTLSAEVYSEVIGSPLYVVQCSQLGITAEDLEKRLQRSLNRAERWNAILLIDEADVYIRERGGDLNQNAIVGVFLRILEYFRGVLFMTSNRATIIDDAILSRVTAHIRYKTPGQDDLSQIFKILCGQFGVEATDELATSFSIHFKGVSGRDTKSLIKLAKLLADSKNEEIKLAHFQSAAKYQDLQIDHYIEKD